MSTTWAVDGHHSVRSGVSDEELPPLNAESSIEGVASWLRNSDETHQCKGRFLNYRHMWKVQNASEVPDALMVEKSGFSSIGPLPIDLLEQIEIVLLRVEGTFADGSSPLNSGTGNAANLFLDALRTLGWRDSSQVRNFPPVLVSRPTDESPDQAPIWLAAMNAFNDGQLHRPPRKPTVRDAVDYEMDLAEASAFIEDRVDSIPRRSWK